MGDQDVLKMQQRKDFLIKFCYWAVIAVCIYAVVKYLLPVVFPFVLAYGIAYILTAPYWEREACLFHGAYLLYELAKTLK